MKDLSNEILAYAIQNALEHGKANPGKVLPKLFQHGLEKSEIKNIMPAVQEAVKTANALSQKEKEKKFEELKSYVKTHDHVEKSLQELPNIPKKGKPVFRCAPFPSGALHLGNMKTFILNALYAEKYKGKLILVMDDTIGSAEKPITPEGYELIEDAFKFADVKYDKKVIYKSDRLKTYYEYAEKLIKKDKAYVCHCAQAPMAENRKNGVECACRQFPEKEQMKRWKEMFKLSEGKATLRIKTDMMHKNPAFRDRVLFKISNRSHPRVKKKYTVWPSLDMAWAIDDHLLKITHIIRGTDLMMETEMEKYIWDIFGWPHPEVFHVGKIRITGTGGTISKSKAQKEVSSGEYQEGWYDPRTWSIQSIARRGITKEALREFVEDIGLNKQDIEVPIDVLYSLNRKIVDLHADRFSFITNPVEINLDGQKIAPTQVPIHPDKDEMRDIKISQLFISQEDFKKYQGKEVRLLHLFNINLDKVLEITSVDNKKIPRLNWISEKANAKILMPNGQWITGITDKAVSTLKPGQIIQFERFGFCRFDKKSKENYEFWFSHK